MTSDSIPSKCKECPQARENAYTKSWYCVNSGAPLASKRAEEFCTAGKGTSITSSNTSSGAVDPATGQGPSPTPEAPKDAAGESSPSENKDPADGTASPKPSSGVPPTEDDLVYGYPFDFM